MRRHRLSSAIAMLGLLAAGCAGFAPTGEAQTGPAQAGQTPTAHTLRYAPGRSITLSLPDSLDINIAATGLRRVRFFAQSPDGRIFVTGMHDLSDNTQGSVFILEGWDAQTHTFDHITH